MNPLTSRVPTPLAINTRVSDEPPVPDVLDALAHANVVSDVHEVVLHATSPGLLAVGEKLCSPKLSPLIVTDLPPDRPAFFGANARLSTGAAQINPSFCHCKSQCQQAQPHAAGLTLAAAQSTCPNTTAAYASLHTIYQTHSRHPQSQREQGT